MSNTAIILAAGLGKRMHAGQNKQFIELLGQSVLTHTINTFAKISSIDKIVLVARAGEEEICQSMIPKNALAKVIITTGGKERQDSVYNGIKAISWQCDYILVHDGARPLVSEEVILRTLNAAIKTNAAICAVPVKDTIKQADENDNVLATIPRHTLWAVQTPQIFRADLLRQAYDHAYKQNYYGTDDASLLEYMGERVKIVMGDYENIKITTPEDIPTAEQILRKRK